MDYNIEVYGAEVKNYLKDNALIKEIQNIMVDINQAVGIEKNELSQDQKVDEIQTKMSAFIDAKNKLNTASTRSPSSGKTKSHSKEKKSSKNNQKPSGM